MKEVKLVSKKTNPDDFGGGDLDWQILEGQTQQIEEDNVIAQAIKKVTIATRDESVGYGVEISKFRGMGREVIPFRVAITVRVLQAIALISKWYHTSIDIEGLDIHATDNVNSHFVFKLKIGQGEMQITV